MNNELRGAIGNLLISLLVGCALTAACLLLASRGPADALAVAAVRYVAPGGVCGDVSPCYHSVQDAVDAAVEGDEIRVAAGTYTRAGTQVLLVEKTVTLRGGYATTDWTTPDPDANVTMLDGQDRRRVVHVIGPISPVLQGFRVIRGKATECAGVQVDEAAAVLRENVIERNRAQQDQPWGAAWGGGICLIAAEGAELLDNVITGNEAFPATGNGRGGGLYASDSTVALHGNVLRNNEAYAALGGGAHGGGLYAAGGSLSFVDGVISGNYSDFDGGGLYMDGGTLAMARTLITGNQAFLGSGGGGYLNLGNAQLVNVVVNDNSVGASGAGVYVEGGAEASVDLVHATLAGNGGGDGTAVSVSSGRVIVTNTVVVSHAVGITVATPALASVDGVLWHGNTLTNAGGDGAIEVSHAVTGAPRFAADGYHLTEGSAAVDEGVHVALSRDIDREPRFGAPDLGVDELWLPGELKRVLLPLVVSSP